MVSRCNICGKVPTGRRALLTEAVPSVSPEEQFRLYAIKPLPDANGRYSLVLCMECLPRVYTGKGVINGAMQSGKTAAVAVLGDMNGGRNDG